MLQKKPNVVHPPIVGDSPKAGGNHISRLPKTQSIVHHVQLGSDSGIDSQLITLLTIQNVFRCRESNPGLTGESRKS
ncbi:hypothetical protein KIN20_016034 [Parelaphostrongylus tenuis]|uniref:Uncharacterized protein n=1 Tax=Parelaphostrongylus tenuis TaxID=148309 RepID=A0AAD5MGX3_PARTN|nr:hypothetical protein KIN20_016034 [Parelaphostrongylus tenuis]